MPGNVLLAPAAVELQMNPADLSLLTELIDIEAVNSSAAGCYEAEVAAYAAQLIGDGPVRVRLTGDSRIPLGRYHLRRDERQMGSHPVSQLRPHTSDEPARDDLAQIAHAERGCFTFEGGTRSTMEQPYGGPPPLRLVTNGCATETQISGARAGRGSNAELQLPEDVAVSREHAKFTYTRGHWWVTNLGRNGLMLNGTPLSGVRLVRPGDSIFWGRHDGALMSRVEIGAGQGLHVGESW
jgi:FHA domain